MTPTREQLELAAKAVGYALADGDAYPLDWNFEKYGIELQGNRWWNPVADKSDSFDLMVAIKASPVYGEDYIEVYAYKWSGTALIADHNNDKGLATMWAGFLCAVEIGGSL